MIIFVFNRVYALYNLHSEMGEFLVMTIHRHVGRGRSPSHLYIHVRDVNAISMLDENFADLEGVRWHSTHDYRSCAFWQ